MNTITYTRATIDDLPDVVNLRLAFAQLFIKVQSPESIEQFTRRNKEYLRKALAGNDFLCYLAKYNEEVVGIGVMVFREQPPGFKNLSGKTGYIMNMYTLPSFRKQGICSHLLTLLIDEAHRLDVTVFELHASEEGEPVYVKNGFQKHGEPTYRKYLK